MADNANTSNIDAFIERWKTQHGPLKREYEEEEENGATLDLDEVSRVASEAALAAIKQDREATEAEKRELEEQEEADKRKKEEWEREFREKNGLGKRAEGGATNINPNPGRSRANVPWHEAAEAASEARDHRERKRIVMRGLADFVRAAYRVHRGASDERIEARFREQTQDDGAETRQDDQSVSNFAQGGFLVPELYSDEVLMWMGEDEVVRPRARVLPVGDPPDAVLHVPKLQTGENLYGGVEVNWIEEVSDPPGGPTENKQQTDFQGDQLDLSPHEVGGHIIATDKLLRNAETASSLISELLIKALIAAQEQAYIQGDGIGKPAGWIGHSGTILVTREVLSEVQYEDLVRMDEEARGNGLVWIGGKRVKGQLQRMTDDAGQLIWNVNAARSIADNAPATVLGYPFLQYERSPLLGATGDLSLVSLENYIIKPGSGPFIAFSNQAGLSTFIRNRTVVKIFGNVDGKPWNDGPLTFDNGDVGSPFVTLDAAVTPP